MIWDLQQPLRLALLARPTRRQSERVKKSLLACHVHFSFMYPLPYFMTKKKAGKITGRPEFINRCEGEREDESQDHHHHYTPKKNSQKNTNDVTSYRHIVHSEIIESKNLSSYKNIFKRFTWLLMVKAPKSAPFKAVFPLLLAAAAANWQMPHQIVGRQVDVVSHRYKMTFLHIHQWWSVMMIYLNWIRCSEFWALKKAVSKK